jgi:lysyl-tRNA synthetase class 2
MSTRPLTPLADRLPLLRRRMRLTEAVRAFFRARGYLEVETPYAVPVPGEEVHLRPARLTEPLDGPEGRRRFLHTSPEFAMKRLLAAGAGPIFQLARVWRLGDESPLHAPEFTLLEWYRPGFGLDDLIEETFVLLRATLPPEVSWGGRSNRLDAYERLSVPEAFARHAGVDLLAHLDDRDALAAAAGITPRPAETWQDVFFRILIERIEPELGRTRPTFLTHWPRSEAALARLDPADPRLALRFELFVCGIELANAFVELTDAEEQRRRFLADRALRARLYGDEGWPLDEDFLAALPAMPEAAGIALGFDRLALLATGAPHIRDVMWL